MAISSTKERERELKSKKSLSTIRVKRCSRRRRRVITLCTACLLTSKYFNVWVANTLEEYLLEIEIKLFGNIKKKLKRERTNSVNLLSVYAIYFFSSSPFCKVEV